MSTGIEREDEKDSDRSLHYFALPVGYRLLDYQIESVLGHGGFGITYLARDLLLDGLVAIKEYLPNELAVRISDSTVSAKSSGDRGDFEAGLKAFLEEARLLARFRHPNIVQVRRFFEAHGTGYIVLDFESGETLSRLLERRVPAEAEIERWLDGILSGLSAVHEQAALHRDLKPNNLIIRENGTPVLIDFGAARDFRDRRSRSITSIATPGYSPPEQYGVGGQQGPWTDFYALGAILYRVVTGQAPVDSLRRLRKDPLQPASEAAAGKFGAGLLGAIDWMLQVDEADRPHSVEQLREALASGVAATARPARSASTPETPPLPPPPARPRFRLGRVAAAIAAVVALGGAYFAHGAYQREQQRLAQERQAQEERARLAKLEEERQQGLRRQLAEAGFEKAAVERVLAACGPTCPTSLSEEAQNRLGEIARDAQDHATARGDKGRLQAYAQECRVCAFKAEAEREVQALEQAERDAQTAALQRRLAQVGYDRAGLERLLLDCSTTCPETLREEIRARLAAEAAEVVQYRNAGEDIGRLRDYLAQCKACLSRGPAEASLERLEQAAREARRLEYARRLSAAGYDGFALRRFVSECGARPCPPDLLFEARNTLALVDRETTLYTGNVNDIDNLKKYMRECIACTYRSQAETRVKYLEEEEERRKEEERRQERERARQRRGLALATAKNGAGVLWEAAWNYEDLESAKASALSRCQRKGRNCQLAWATGPRCLALATVGNGWAARHADTREAARQAAISACFSINKQTCKLRGAWCND